MIPLQLLGYYMSVARGLDVDKPQKPRQERDGGVMIIMRENMIDHQIINYRNE